MNAWPNGSKHPQGNMKLSQVAKLLKTKQHATELLLHTPSSGLENVVKLGN